MLNPSGLCQCGCGEMTRVASRTVARRLQFKGEPMRFVLGHHARLMSADTKAKLAAAQRGRKHPPEVRAKIGRRGPANAAYGKPGQRGAAHGQWKGDDVSYRVLHKWLDRNYEKTSVCEECGAPGKTEWANVSGEYRREDRGDWLELCRSCHCKRDGLIKNVRSGAN